MSPVLQDRLQKIMALSLSSGSHADFEKGACVMEAAAYIAGEPWSDHPKCACPVITSFMIAWNDGLPSDAERDRLLKPLIEEVIDTKATLAVAKRRSYMALDWLIRVHTPKWLDLVPALATHAKALRDLEEIADLAGASAAGANVKAAGDAARDAAREAARAAAREAARDAGWDVAWAAGWDATGDAARAAAWAAAGDAARYAARYASGDAARDAAGAAAKAAAWAAAWDVARAAAREFLKPTTAWLQVSALDLVRRMIEVR